MTKSSALSDPASSGEEHIINHKIYGTFGGKESSKSLPQLCLDLLSEQRRTWRDLEKGYELLREVREREISCDGFSVRLQYNPGRMKSSTANVRERDVRGRPCFLCLKHLPEGQEGILHRNEYLILCNPMPVFSSHLTITHVDHRLQSISENIDTLLQLMVDFGLEWKLLYNGPKCGASAPDHHHFQAIPSGKMPIEKEMEETRRFTLLRQVEGVAVMLLRDVGREIVMLQGDQPSKAGAVVKSFLSALKKVLLIDGEPMMNIVGSYSEKKWRLMIFPRRKHRPDIFFKEGDERVVVSPGVIDMGGVLITPVVKDFERLDATALEAIYREVSMERRVVERAIDAMVE